MTDESAITVPPALVLRGRGTRVQLHRQGVLLDRRGVRTTIPPAAVARAEAAGPGGRTLRIVLTADRGDGRTYTVRCRSAPAVRAFAAGIVAAVPVGDGEARRLDGHALVRTAPVPTAGRRAFSRTARITWTSVALYATGLVLIVATARAPAFAVLLWTIAPLFLAPSLFCLVRIGGLVREWWGLKVRGVTVVGDLTDTTYGEEGTTYYTYRYQDADGVERTHFSGAGPWPEGSATAELTYDPAHPDRVGVRGAGWSAVVQATLVGVVLAVFAATALLGLCFAAAALAGPWL
ncbi:hypothetical protein ACH4PU_29680 [Streptomyces sp. NPDC021100]|uniref:hypothetical protein n=1 Tax=Streptomyces sp. NPDC021100 TaxID=3365114 RepID=UPI0037B7952C